MPHDYLAQRVSSDLNMTITTARNSTEVYTVLAKSLISRIASDSEGTTSTAKDLGGGTLQWGTRWCWKSTLGVVTSACQMPRCLCLSRHDLS